jgi:hypothetical protein
VSWHRMRYTDQQGKGCHSPCGDSCCAHIRVHAHHKKPQDVLNQCIFYTVLSFLMPWETPTGFPVHPTEDLNAQSRQSSSYQPAPHHVYQPADGTIGYRGHVWHPIRQPSDRDLPFVSTLPVQTTLIRFSGRILLLQLINTAHCPPLIMPPQRLSY